MSMNGIRGPRGGNARNGRTSFPQYEARKASAAARKAVSDARTPEEQIKRLDAAGLTSVKERLKLAKRIAARDAKPSPKFDREPRQITAEDAKKLSRPPKKLKVTIPVTIQE